MEKNVHETKRETLHQLAMRKNTLWQKVSSIDLKITDVMHFLESEKYDAVMMVKLACQLRDLRQERRDAKVELEQIQSLSDVIKGDKIDRFAKKGYTYRTDVLKDLTGIEHGQTRKH